MGWGVIAAEASHNEAHGEWKGGGNHNWDLEYLSEVKACLYTHQGSKCEPFGLAYDGPILQSIVVSAVIPCSQVYGQGS
jgi:hypothetical protein